MKQYYAEHNVPEPVMPRCQIPDRLRGQNALVTGASSGIGQAVAIALGQAGANVCVNYAHGREEAEETVGVIQQERRQGLRRTRRTSPASRRCRRCSPACRRSSARSRSS